MWRCRSTCRRCRPGHCSRCRYVHRERRGAGDRGRATECRPDRGRPRHLGVTRRRGAPSTRAVRPRVEHGAGVGGRDEPDARSLTRLPLASGRRGPHRILAVSTVTVAGAGDHEPDVTPAALESRANGGTRASATRQRRRRPTQPPVQLCEAEVGGGSCPQQHRAGAVLGPAVDAAVDPAVGGRDRAASGGHDAQVALRCGCGRGRSDSPSDQRDAHRHCSHLLTLDRLAQGCQPLNIPSLFGDPSTGHQPCGGISKPDQSARPEAPWGCSSLAAACRHRRRALSAVTPAAAQTPQDVVVAPGTISSATAMAFAPDGRIFVAQQGGAAAGGQERRAALDAVRHRAGRRRPASAGCSASRSTRTSPRNHYVYVYYTRRRAAVAQPRQPLHRQRRPRRRRRQRDGPPRPEHPVAAPTNHNGGALHFGPDGKLYVAVGENANSARTRRRSTNAARQDAAHQPRRHDPDRQPVLRRRPPATNRAIWALGLRNPFTFASSRAPAGCSSTTSARAPGRRSTTGDRRGANYGWPTTEGPTSDPRFTSAALRLRPRPATAAARSPAARSTTRRRAQFPAELRRRLLLRRLLQRLDQEHRPGRRKTVHRRFATGSRGRRSTCDVAADGSLYYLARGAAAASTASRYTGSSSPPSISAAPDEPDGRRRAARDLHRRGVAARAPLTYQWQRNGADIAGRDVADATRSPERAAGRQRRAVPRASSPTPSAARRATRPTLTVTTNQPPTATITAPAGRNASTAAGDTITYAGTGTDPEDGTLAGARLHVAGRLPPRRPRPPVPAARHRQRPAARSSIPTTGRHRARRLVPHPPDGTRLRRADARRRSATCCRATVARSRWRRNPAGLQLTLDGQPFTAPHDVRGRRRHAADDRGRRRRRSSAARLRVPSRGRTAARRRTRSPRRPRTRPTPHAFGSCCRCRAGRWSRAPRP